MDKHVSTHTQWDGLSKKNDYSTGQFSREVKHEQLLNCSPKDDGSTSNRDLCLLERKKENECYRKTTQHAQFSTKWEVCDHS